MPFKHDLESYCRSHPPRRSSRLPRSVPCRTLNSHGPPGWLSNNGIGTKCWVGRIQLSSRRATAICFRIPRSQEDQAWRRDLTHSARVRRPAAICWPRSALRRRGVILVESIRRDGPNCGSLSCRTLGGSQESQCERPASVLPGSRRMPRRCRRLRPPKLDRRKSVSPRY